jgi:hypothetical protein
VPIKLPQSRAIVSFFVNGGGAVAVAKFLGEMLNPGAKAGW